MKKRLLLIFVFLLIISLVPYKTYAKEYTCKDLNNIVNSYDDVLDELESIDCENTRDSDEINTCNEDNMKKTYYLSKLFKYNDEVKGCKNNRFNEIIKENKDNCTNVFGSTIQDVTNTVMSLFYIIAPFLIIIYGSLDFSKIVVMNDPAVIKESRSNFFKRLIAFILLYMVPFFVNKALDLNLSNYSLSGDFYTCKNDYIFYMDHWDITYVPPVTMNNRKVNFVTASNWHQDWFQCSDPWADHQYGSDTLCDSGCGSFATSIVCAHYSGDDSPTSFCYPTNTADEYTNHNMVTNKVRTGITTFFNEWHPELGLTATDAIEGDVDFNRLDSVLAAGGCAIMDFQDYTMYDNRHVWTTGGHYVTIIAGNQKDGYRVADSNGGHESGASGISEWAPYSTHTFDKEFIQSPWYYYLIEKK